MSHASIICSDLSFSRPDDSSGVRGLPFTTGAGKSGVSVNGVRGQAVRRAVVGGRGSHGE